MTRLGDRLPADFQTAHRRQRIIRAFAEIVIERGHPGSVAEIVSRTGVARNTFYETFGGKDDAGRALIAKVLPDLANRLEPADVGRSGLGVLAMEVAARAEMGAEAAAVSHAVDALGTLRAVAESVGAVEEGEESLLCSLPPGRHGLPKDFILANQLHRLFTALAEAIHERGFRRLTVADVTNRAKVSRRTFYEHFSHTEDAATALCSHASTEALIALKGVGVNSGLGILVVEVVATGLAEGRSAAIALADSVEYALLPIGDSSQATEVAA